MTDTGEEIVKNDLSVERAGVILCGAMILCLPDAAYAYVGPGAGLSIVGSVLAFLAAIVVGVFGFLWFPIKRLLRRRKEAAARKTATARPETRGEAESADGGEAKREGTEE